MYCVQDKKVSGIGGTSAQGKMSPENLLATTIGDELRLASNFKAGYSVSQLKTGVLSFLQDEVQMLPIGLKMFPATGYPAPGI